MSSRGFIRPVLARLAASASLGLVAASIWSTPAATADPEPTITGGFESTSMVVGQDGSFTWTIANNSAERIEFLNLVNRFPDELQVDTAASKTTCRGELEFEGSPTTVLLFGVALDVGERCELVMAFKATAEGSLVNNGDAVDVFIDEEPSDTADRTPLADPPLDDTHELEITAPAAPTGTASLSPTTMLVGQDGTTSLTITNPNPVAYANLQLHIGLPSPVDRTDSLTDCPNATVTTTLGGSRIRVDITTLPANTTCALTVDYTATDPADSRSVFYDIYEDPTPDSGGADRIRHFFGTRTITIDPVPLPLTLLGTPCAVYDSRTASGAISGTFDGGDSRRLTVTGSLPPDQGVGTTPCVPSGASSVVFTVSAIDPVAGGNLRLSPAGVAPTGGVVNYAANGLDNANTVTVPLSADGRVDLAANGGPTGEFLPSTDVRLVAIGYHSADGTLDFNTITPCAVADSRINNGADGVFEGPFSAGSFPDVEVIGEFPGGQGGGNTDCNVPSSATAVLINVVAINASGGSGFLAVGPGGTDPTEALTPFADIGMNNAATTIVEVDNNGRIALDIEATTGNPTTHVRVVVLGYYDGSGLNFWSVTPCASFDTRSNQGASGAFLGDRVGGSTTTFDVVGTFSSAQGGGNTDCGVPDDARAVLINLVAINALREGNLRISAGGVIASGGVLNFDALTPAMNNANTVVVPVNNDGEIDVFANGGPPGNGVPLSHVRGIILGYFD